jgi:hypothetical protein
MVSEHPIYALFEQGDIESALNQYGGAQAMKFACAWQESPSNRRFTSSDFVNGKIINPDVSGMIYERISRAILPFPSPSSSSLIYTDRKDKKWSFIESPKYIMYAKVEQDKQFAIHTDTGCEYDDCQNKYSKFTTLTYLNDDYEGGNTIFYDKMFKETCRIIPRKGLTLCFDIDLFHAGGKVTRGTKYWVGTELVCAK